MIPWYVRRYGINTAELERGVHEFATLSSFFTRGLREHARPIHPTGVISPVDGVVSQLGIISDGTLVQAKGHTYSLASLLADEDSARAYAGGHYITLYLSPKNYHRIHSPIDGVVMAWRHVPGSLYPVNRSGVRNIPGLYTKNERLVAQVSTDMGEMCVVMVGATNVGSIMTAFTPVFTREYRRRRQPTTVEDVNVPMCRGQEFGRFELGSTVILVFQAGMIRRFVVSPGSAIQMGQQIAMLQL